MTTETTYTLNEILDDPWFAQERSKYEIYPGLVRKFEEKGLVLAWIRYILMNSIDRNSLQDAAMRGYIIVRREDLEEYSCLYPYPEDIDRLGKDCICFQDLVLMARPINKAVADEVNSERKARENDELVRQEFRKNERGVETAWQKQEEIFTGKRPAKRK